MPFASDRECGIPCSGNMWFLVSVAILSNFVISTFNSSEPCHPLGPHQWPLDHLKCLKRPQNIRKCQLLE